VGRNGSLSGSSQKGCEASFQLRDSIPRAIAEVCGGYLGAVNDGKEEEAGFRMWGGEARFSEECALVFFRMRHRLRIYSSNFFRVFAATISQKFCSRISTHCNDCTYKASMKPTIPQSAAAVQTQLLSPSNGPANDPAPEDAPLDGLASPLPLAVGLLSAAAAVASPLSSG